MSDERLRELERRFRTSGDKEDEAAWLRARVLAGELTEDRQSLLAYLGRPVPDPSAFVHRRSRNPRELAGWVHGLPHFDGARHFPWAIEIYWRVGAALAWTIPEEEVNEAPRAARLMEEWIAEPAARLVDELVALQDSVGSQIARWTVLPNTRRQSRLLEGLTLALAPARWPGIPVNAMPSKATETLATELSVSVVLDGLLAELVPWALGISDPLRARVEARKREPEAHHE